MGDYLTYSAAATNNKIDGARALAEARTAQKQAYSQAYSIENDAASGLSVAGDNLMRMQRNKTNQLASQRNAQVGSGFSHTGSKLATEKSLAEVLDMAIADQMQSASTAASNAYAQANLTRHQGDSQLAMGQISEQFYTRLADANKSFGKSAFVGQLLQYPFDIAFKYNATSK